MVPVMIVTLAGPGSLRSTIFRMLVGSLGSGQVRHIATNIQDEGNPWMLKHRLDYSLRLAKCTDIICLADNSYYNVAARALAEGFRTGDPEAFSLASEALAEARKKEDLVIGLLTPCRLLQPSLPQDCEMMAYLKRLPLPYIIYIEGSMDEVREVNGARVYQVGGFAPAISAIRKILSERARL